MNIKTSNIILYCKKWNETVTFYRDMLRFPIHFSNEWFVEFSLTGNARLSVANEERSSIKSCQGKGITISLEVEDIETMYSLMEVSGLRAREKITSHF
jgi:hypothetical protein